MSLADALPVVAVVLMLGCVAFVSSALLPTQLLPPECGVLGAFAAGGMKAAPRRRCDYCATLTPPQSHRCDSCGAPC